MSTPPSTPVERHSLYPEPHRVGDWSEPSPPHRSLLIPILGALGVVLVLVGIIALGLSLGRENGTDTPVVTNPNGIEINAIQADPGICLAVLPEDGVVARVTAVPCGTPHRAEVVSSYRLAGDSWPGDESVETQVLGHCGSFIQPGFDADSMFKPSDWEDGLRWVAWLPTEKSWGIDERSGVCVVYRNSDIVGSFVEGTAAFIN